MPLVLVLVPPIADAEEAEGIPVEEEEVLPDEDATVVFRPFFPGRAAATFLAGGFLSRSAGGIGGTAPGFAAALAFRCCCCCCWRCCAKAVARALCCCCC